MTFTELMTHVAEGFEVVGVVVLIIGLIWTISRGATSWRHTGYSREGYRVMRESFEHALLLGLEILVAADLIRTIAISPTLENVAALGLIVLIRTFLSFSLEIELEGVVPWRRAIVLGARPVGGQDVDLLPPDR